MIKMLRPFLAKLSNREKLAIGIGIGFIGIFIIVNLAIFPFVDSRERLERSLASHTRSYNEIKQLRQEYLAMQNRADNSKTRFNRRQRGFTLFSFLDKLAGQVGIKERITYMKPTSTKQKDAPYSLSLVEMKTEWNYHGADHPISLPDRNITKHDSCPALVPQQEGRERGTIECDSAGRNI